MNQTPEHDYRAHALSDLRALVDMLENEPSLPVPMSFSCAVYLPRPTSNTDDLVPDCVTEVFAAAAQLGTEVTYLPRDGRVETTWRRGCVSYRVYTRVPYPQEPTDAITVASVSEVARATRPSVAEPEHVSTALLREAAEPLVDGDTTGGVA